MTTCSRSPGTEAHPAGEDRRHQARRRAVIVTSAAGQEDPAYIARLVEPSDIVIGADGGAAVVLRLGLRPDLVVGDLDSLDPVALREVEAVSPVEVHPVRKDRTDTHLAIERARAQGVSEIVVCGAFGDRPDHNLGLLLLVAGLGAPPRVRLVGARYEAFIARGRSELSGRPGDVVSLLPLSPTVTGITTEGLLYPLEGTVLSWGETLGVSNEMLGSEAAVTCETGVLLVVHLKGRW